MRHFRLSIGHRTAARAVAAIQGRLKLANLMEMSETDFEKQLSELEKAPLFKLLKASGAVSLAEFPAARYAARNFAGYGLKLSGGSLPELVDGKGDLAELARRVGLENFEACFLREDGRTDEQRAEVCGISLEEVRRLRDMVNRAFIQEEFAGKTPEPAARVFSSVAGIQVENGAPVLAFFNREIWKGRYKVDVDKLAEFSGTLPEEERGRLERLLKKIEFAEQRKSTLYRALEILLSVQSEYFISGEPARRRPISQKTMAKNLGVDPSVLNRLVSNKSIQLPWGLEAPMSALLPSSKEINRDRLYDLASENPALTDKTLCSELENRYGVRLSRRSVAQYRKELSLGSRGRR